jgi:DNA-binding IclR family transcriptional regulator
VLAAPLQAYTKKTATNPVRLREMLATVRRNGYAVSDGQVTLDAVSVAAPITGPDGVVAAVSLVVRAETAQPTALAPLVMAAARGISRALKMP